MPYIWFYRFLRGLSSLFFDLIGFDQTLVLTSIDFSADWGRFFVGCWLDLKGPFVFYIFTALYCEILTLSPDSLNLPTESSQNRSAMVEFKKWVEIQHDRSVRGIRGAAATVWRSATSSGRATVPYRPKMVRKSFTSRWRWSISFKHAIVIRPLLA